MLPYFICMQSIANKVIVSNVLLYIILCLSQEKNGEPVPDAIWPENGDQWSDKEEDDECGLLQEMAEEDEEIDLYNEETFGLGIIRL